jgi:serine/threonine protein kinase
LKNRTELEQIAPLGVGTFGFVSLVRHSTSGKMYALKAMSKAKIVALKQQRNIVYERALLGATSHPFLLSLITTYQDADSLYSLFEWIQGGELFGRIESQGKLDPAAAKFYAASVVHGIAYLHAMHVVYRDVKPENLLIDKTGYIRVVDFGFAKHVPERTYTLCGTPSYLAPECLTGTGYGKSCDWWAVGVLGYEMLTGRNPFDDEGGDAQKTVRNVLRQRVQFPESLLDADAKAVGFVRDLLQRKVVNRLGCRMDGAQEVMRHRWFSDMDWRGLLRKEVPAPWVPHLSSATDVSHFDGALQSEAGAATAPAADTTINSVLTDDWCAHF